VSQTDANTRTKTPNYNVLFITIIIIHEFHGDTKSQTKLQAKHVLLQQKRSSDFSEIKVNTVLHKNGGQQLTCKQQFQGAS